MPPKRAARPVTIIIGSNVTTPRVVAAIRIPPRPMAAFDAKAVFRHPFQRVRKFLDLHFEFGDLLAWFVIHAG